LLPETKELKHKIPILKEIEKIKRKPDSEFIAEEVRKKITEQLKDNAEEKIKQIIEQKKRHEISELEERLKWEKN